MFGEYDENDVRGFLFRQLDEKGVFPQAAIPANTDPDLDDFTLDSFGVSESSLQQIIEEAESHFQMHVDEVIVPGDALGDLIEVIVEGGSNSAGV